MAAARSAAHKIEIDCIGMTADTSGASARATRLAEICGALPEATVDFQGNHRIYRVRKKVFAYYLNDHHGDGIISVCCKVLPGDNAALIAAHPRKFYMPAYIGPRGWVALRLDTPKVDWEEVAELIRGSYQLVAPPKLTRAAGF